jgi:hypothetical protein
VIFKILVAVVAAGLLLAFLSPVVLKLKDVALSLVVIAGLVLMLVDLWHSIRSKED